MSRLRRRIIPATLALVLPLAAGSALGPAGPAEAKSCVSTIGSDFNGDGFADLAVGEPGADGSRGAVHVLYGSAAGLTAAATGTSPANQYFGQDILHRSGAAAVGEVFGHAVATGDFNGDKCDDLAVGAPYDGGGKGLVSIVYGSPSGLVLDKGVQRIAEGFAGTVDRAEAEDLFGWAVATGDLNGDGLDDLAVGSPGEVGAGRTGFNQGSVIVMPGSPTGLRRSESTLWSQDSPDVPDAAENGDRFGTSLATGDFNRDGKADLAVGAPGENTSAGAIIVLAGATSGLTGRGSSRWLQSSVSGFGSARERGDLFGQALAAGDFNGDGAADLAVGVPGENESTGLVDIGHGAPGLLAPSAPRMINQRTPGIAQRNEGLDEFGASLATGDFNGDGKADLAIGVPGEGDGTITASGAVAVVYGGPKSLTGSGGQWWTQNSTGIPDTAQSFDRFGSAVVALRVRSGRQDDLIIGAPSETISGQKLPLSGTVHLIKGSTGRLTAGGSQLWEPGTKDVRGSRFPGGNFGHAVA